MSVYEVIFSAANSCISHQLRYVNAVRRIPWYVTIMCNVPINFKPGRDGEGGGGAAACGQRAGVWPQTEKNCQMSVSGLKKNCQNFLHWARWRIRLDFSLSSNFGLFWNSKTRSSWSSFSGFFQGDHPLTNFHRTNLHLAEDPPCWSQQLVPSPSLFNWISAWIIGTRMTTLTLQT